MIKTKQEIIDDILEKEGATDYEDILFIAMEFYAQQFIDELESTYKAEQDDFRRFPENRIETLIAYLKECIYES